MKKFLAFALLLCMAFSLCTLSGCNKKPEVVENIYEDFEEFDSFVPAGSDIIGTWKMTAPRTDMEWQFFANTTLHQTSISGDVRTSNVCIYNYNGEGDLKVYSFADGNESSFSVMMEKNKLVLTDTDGVEYTFDRLK